MKKYVCIEKYSLYRVLYYPWFQANDGVLGTTLGERLDTWEGRKIPGEAVGKGCYL